MIIDNTPTPHNEAKFGDIADVVLMPGDPLRAKMIAENFLEDAICFNNVRGMLGYTGLYKGKKISVMGSGMGVASIGIYSYELYKFYGVKKIIRIGSCGAYSDKLQLLDTIIVNNVYSESNFAKSFRGRDTHFIKGSELLTDNIEKTASKLSISIVKGDIVTTECFDSYIETEKMTDRLPKELNCIAAEMECYALFNVADELKKEAACLLSVVDSVYTSSRVSAEDRQKNLNNMIKIALEAVV